MLVFINRAKEMIGLGLRDYLKIYKCTFLKKLIWLSNIRLEDRGFKDKPSLYRVMLVLQVGVCSSKRGKI